MLVVGSGNSQAIGYLGGIILQVLYHAKTEFWNGTAWTEVNDLATARYHNTGAGTGSSALAGGGIYTSSRLQTTEEWKHQQQTVH
jgi:hypothetical protein